MPRTLILPVLALLAGCATAPAATTLTGPAWTLESIAGEAPAGARPATLRFEEGRLAGQGPCNRYGGSWRLEEGQLRLSALFATRMACPQPAMAQEARLLRLLESVRVHRLTSDRLEIIGEGGARLVARR
jgi:heat shock protein HslJ